MEGCGLIRITGTNDCDWEDYETHHRPVRVKGSMDKMYGCWVVLNRRRNDKDAMAMWVDVLRAFMIDG